MKFKHWCGCITKKNEDKIEFVEMCQRHKENQKYIWIALQHPKK